MPVLPHPPPPSLSTITALLATAANTFLEPRKSGGGSGSSKHRSRPNKYKSKIRFGPMDLSDPRKRLIFILTLVGTLVAVLFVVGLVRYGRQEWDRKKSGKKFRTGRVLLKSLALATLLAGPIWVYKRLRERRRQKKLAASPYSFEKSRDKRFSSTPSLWSSISSTHKDKHLTRQTQWYGSGTDMNTPPPTTEYVGAGGQGGYAYNYGAFGGDDEKTSGDGERDGKKGEEKAEEEREKMLPSRGEERELYDEHRDAGVAHAAIEGYAAPRYDAPVGGVHQPPPPERD